MSVRTINAGPCRCCGSFPPPFPPPAYPCPNICGKPIGCGPDPPPGYVGGGWWKFKRGTASVTAAPYIGCVGGLSTVACAAGWAFDTDVPFWNNGATGNPGDPVEQIEVSGCGAVLAFPCEDHVEGADDQGGATFGSTHQFLGILPEGHACEGGVLNSYVCIEQATFALSCKHSNGRPVCTFTKYQAFTSNGAEGCQCVIDPVAQEACVPPGPFACPDFETIVAGDTITLTYTGTDFVTTWEFEWVP